MFIVSLVYKRPIEDVEKHLAAHVDYLKKEYAAGSFIASGRKVPRTGGIILSQIKTRPELEDCLARDPFHSAGIADYEIVEFVPSMVAEGFEKIKEI